MMNSRLIVNDIELDLNDQVAFPLNFSIADSKEPNKRKRNFSKRVMLPGTQTNMEFFSSTYCMTLTSSTADDIGFSFDPTKRLRAKYYKNGIIQFDGLIQLNEVILDKKNYQFECTMFSNFIDLFMALGEIKVAELGWSEYNHALTRTNIKNSWDSSVVKNGIDTTNFTGGNPDGFGYLYPLVDYGFNTYSPALFRIDNIIPLVYCREVVEKAIGYVGMTYESEYFDSVLFKKQLLGYEGGKRNVFTPTEINNRKVDFFGDFAHNIALSPTYYPFISDFYETRFNYNVNLIVDSVINETEVSDLTNQYQAANGFVTIQKTGMYNLAISYEADIDVTYNDGQTQILGSYIRALFQVIRNGQQIYTQLDYSYQNGNTGITQAVNQTLSLQLNSGDVIGINMNVSGSRLTDINGTIDIDVASTTDLNFLLTSANTTILDGDTVELSTVIPDMTAKSFLEGIITTGNLYLSDPDINNVIKIEPLTSFYQPTNVFDDWTELIDHSKPIKFVPASTIDGKQYRYEFEKQDDYDNDLYQKEFSSGYGNKIYNVESTFQSGERTFKIPFGQAVPIQLVGSGIVLPRIVKLNNNNVFEPYKGKPKLYFYNGLKSGWFRMLDIDQVGYEDLPNYPAVHHFDDFENPTFDLNFELPKKVYYAATIVTTYNWFSAYHEKFIRELTGRDAKIINCFARLTPAEINTIDFGRLKMWNGSLYRLNEIKDFDSDKSESTAIELIRIIEGDSPNTQVIGAVTNSDAPFTLTGGTSVDEDTGVIFGGIGVAQNSSLIYG